MHHAITVGIPVLAILFAALWNNHGLGRLEGRMERLEARIGKVQSDLTSRIDRLQADLSQFYRDPGRHDADIEAI
jgi:hypothetical protein